MPEKAKVEADASGLGTSTGQGLVVVPSDSKRPFKNHERRSTSLLLSLSVPHSQM